MTIDATIQRLTNDGEVVVQFLVDVIQGTNYNAPLGHRIKSAEWLSALGGFIPEDAIPKSATIRPRPKSETKQDKADKADNQDKKLSVTEKQILHFDIARLIKQETNDGETVVEFLIRVISKIEKSGENFTPAARMRAARELLVRGFGSAIPGVSRILSGKTEELDSYLSKIVREYTDHGADSVRFLVKAMENKTPEVDSKGAQTPYPKFERQRKTKPAEGFTASQRVWAACELLRRAYDIRTDHITPDDIQAYWNAQTPAANPGRAAGERPAAAENIAAAQNIAAAEKPAPDRQPAANSDSAPAAETRASRRRQKRAARKAEKLASATEQRDDHKQPTDAANVAAKEKSAATTEKRDAATEQRDADKQRAAAENPAAANPDSAPAAETRASRRRQKRDARKAEKRAATEQPAAAKNIAAIKKREDNGRNADNTLSANPGNPGRAARRREQRVARKAEKRANANTSIGNPMPGAIHATDINENTVVFSHEPISPEELTRLRKSLAQPDDIPPNARSP